MLLQIAMCKGGQASLDLYMFSGAPPCWPRLRPSSIVIAALHTLQQQMQTRQGHRAGCPVLLFAHLHVNTSLTVSPEGEHRNPSYKYIQAGIQASCMMHWSYLRGLGLVVKQAAKQYFITTEAHECCNMKVT